MAIPKRWWRRSADPGGTHASTEDLPEAVPEKTQETGQEPGPSPSSSQDVAASSDTLVETPRAPSPQDPSRKRFSIGDLSPFLFLRAAHPRQAILTAVGLSAAAALADRPSRDVVLVFVTVLVGQAILGWHNDLVDRKRDLAHHTARKPVSDGRLDPGNVWFVLICAVLLVVPLSISNGVAAGSAYLGSLVVGLMANVVLRKGFFSWTPWAVSFALYPAFLSYGGWGGGAQGNPPEISITILAALLGIGAHFLSALWGLVADNEDGWTYLPLRLGLRLGAARLLTLTSVYIALVLIGLVFAGTKVGLDQ